MLPIGKLLLHIGVGMFCKRVLGVAIDELMKLLSRYLYAWTSDIPG